MLSYHFFFFFFNDTATTEIYTLPLHDALPISWAAQGLSPRQAPQANHRTYHVRLVIELLRPPADPLGVQAAAADRKSTRLNSSHGYISYAVFCLKKKKTKIVSYNIQHRTSSTH